MALQTAEIIKDGEVMDGVLILEMIVWADGDKDDHVWDVAMYEEVQLAAVQVAKEGSSDDG